MRAIGRAFVAVVLLVAPSTASLAMPVKANPGDIRCKCSCRGTNWVKDLDWAKTKTCGLSNGQGCKATFDGGKTFQVGTLGSCTQCQYQTASEYTCGPASFILKPRTPPGTLQPTPPPAKTTP